MQGERDAAAIAYAIAVAVARVQYIIDLLAVEWDQPQPVRDEFIGQDRGVGVEFDRGDGEGGDFGEYDTAKRIGECEVDVAQSKVDPVAGDLRGVW